VVVDFFALVIAIVGATDRYISIIIITLCTSCEFSDWSAHLPTEFVKPAVALFSSRFLNDAVSIQSTKYKVSNTINQYRAVSGMKTHGQNLNIKRQICRRATLFITNPTFDLGGELPYNR
jgi:hypothetical protein